MWTLTDIGILCPAPVALEWEGHKWFLNHPSQAPRSSGIDIDGVDGTHVDTKHTVDTLCLVNRIGFDVALGVAGCICPLEHVDGTVLEAGTIGHTDIEIDSHVCAVDSLLFRFVDRPPDSVLLVFLGDIAVRFEVWIDSHENSSIRVA